MTHHESRVQVVSDLLGSYVKGSILPASTFGDQLDHLLEIGAIRDYDSNEPWEGNPTQTYLEAIHSSSPPTLPNAPYVDVEPEVVRAVLGDVPDNTPIITAHKGVLGEPKSPKSAEHENELAKYDSVKEESTEPKRPVSRKDT